MLRKISTFIVILGILSVLATAAPISSAGDLIQKLKDKVKRQIVIPTPASTTFPTAGSGSKANNFQFPLNNGFPSIASGSPQESAINSFAQGSISNGPRPSTFNLNSSVTNLQFVAFNELFEVAFFTDLLKNVTRKVKGYQNVPSTIGYNYLVNTLASIQAQEELHALNANRALDALKQPMIQPCKYKFPSTRLPDAIWLAQMFTDVVLGTLQDVLAVYATIPAGRTVNDANFVRGQSSSLGQEGEQVGFFRYYQGKKPSAQPFLTTATRKQAYSALNQNFIVQGSCPTTNNINIPILPPLRMDSQAPTTLVDQTLSFSFVNTTALPSTGLNMAFINGQNLPTITNITLTPPKNKGGRYRFSVLFPAKTKLFYGLTIGVVTGSFQNNTSPNVSVVDTATLFGPAFIELL